LITYSAIDEVVADSTVMTKTSVVVNSLNRFSPIPIFPSLEKQIVLIGKGKVLAGIDLRKLNDADVTLANDTVFMNLPRAQIIDAILNPSDFETFAEKGNWTENEVTLVKDQARRKIIQRAIDRNIIEKADAKSRALIEKFVRDLGHKNVVIK
jgi:hypothetical protein